MIISINAEKAFDKMQHSFMVNIFNKLGREGNIVNTMKGFYEKNPQLTSHSDQEQERSTLTTITCIQQCTASSTQGNQARKRNKGIKIGKKEVK